MLIIGILELTSIKLQIDTLEKIKKIDMFISQKGEEDPRRSQTVKKYYLITDIEYKIFW